MPIVTDPLPNPTDIVMQGASIGDDFGTPLPFMTAAQMMQPMALQSPLLAAGGQGFTMAGNVTWKFCCMLDENVLVTPNLNAGEQPLDMVFPPTDTVLNAPLQPKRLQDNFIFCSAGTMIPAQDVMPMNQHPLGVEGQYEMMIVPMVNVPTNWQMASVFPQSTATFSIVGITKTGAGAALASCRVMAMETGRMEMDALTGTRVQQAHVGETVSDVSGNFTLSVPTNTAFQLTAYKAGAPDVAGITRNDVTPLATSTTIYLRDPTTQDVAGSASYRPIGSPVIRRISL